MSERWTPEKRARHGEMTREWHKSGINRAKFLAAQFRSWTPERRAKQRERMLAFYADPERSAEARARASEAARNQDRSYTRRGGHSLPRELFPDERDLYREIKRKGKLTRAEALALVIKERKTKR